MKKIKIITLSCVMLIILFACDDSSDQIKVTQRDEQYYKAQLEKLLHTELKDVGSQTDVNQNSLKFKSFEEAYSFFSSIKNKSFIATKTLVSTSVKNFPSESARVMYGTVFQNYFFSVQQSFPVSDFHVSGTISASYVASITAGYPYKTDITGTVRTFTGPNQGMSLSASTPQFGYSGGGQLEGGISSSGFVLGAYNGVYNGVASGALVVKGVNLGNFQILFSGGFTINIGPSPGGAVLTPYLTARIITN